jgi:hypothetical protein
MAAAATTTVATSSSSAMDWSTINSVRFLRFGRRLGGRIKPANQPLRYDGANGAVFAASLITPTIVSSSTVIIDDDEEELAVKIIFNVHDLASRDVRVWLATTLARYCT